MQNARRKKSWIAAGLKSLNCPSLRRLSSCILLTHIPWDWHYYHYNITPFFFVACFFFNAQLEALFLFSLVDKCPVPIFFCRPFRPRPLRVAQKMKFASPSFLWSLSSILIAGRKAAAINSCTALPAGPLKAKE